ncbi:hypothetical protein [Methylovirgula sp. HY1]|uniref:phage major tropism determinant n=1 Tax=Methylovirgula sp. HY1 TaxID=2822761 RepID=UPI001C5AE107|nr:hypothetical protein [Methylovirgula sp. HY1]QXX74228.1 hypothetical protein MHY1_01038 [Methylovirgula sp. HY1]
MSTYYDRVMCAVASAPGTGPISLAAAIPTYQTFANAGALTGAMLSYLIKDGTSWEFGWGTYSSTGPALARTTILGSSNSGAAISASSSAIVSSVLLGEDMQGIVNGLATAFSKASSTGPAFTVTGAGTININAGTAVALNGFIYNFSTATAVVMPTLTGGTDYAVYICNDGTVRADASFSAPTGYTTAQSRQIGGFHYAPGGNAAAMAGGNTTPAINPYSVWDLKWRPRCADPRGMALVAGAFWADIYLCNTAPDANGTSGYNLNIASGSRLPVIPAMFGGNGSTAYSEFNWWDANEVMFSAGKRLLSTAEFQVAAYGTTEESSLTADPVTTGLSGGVYTSKWGMIQATGCYWVWGRELGGPYSAASWTQSTGNRGQFYNMPNAVILGAPFGGAAFSGSRASNWSGAASSSSGNVGARGCCDHLMLA